MTIQKTLLLSCRVQTKIIVLLVLFASWTILQYLTFLVDHVLMDITVMALTAGPNVTIVTSLQKYALLLEYVNVSKIIITTMQVRT